MITAHLPSGYLLGKLLSANTPVVMAAVMIGAIFPDFDLLWFYLIDERAFHHHRYWVHAPGFWVMVCAILTPVLAMWNRIALKLFLFFVTGIYLHILLDAIAGGIMWLWPYSNTLFEWVTVTPTHRHFVLSFMMHWTFLLEIAVWIAAIVIFARHKWQNCAQ